MPLTIRRICLLDECAAWKNMPLGRICHLPLSGRRPIVAGNPTLADRHRILIKTESWPSFVGNSMNKSLVGYGGTGLSSRGHRGCAIKMLWCHRVHCTAVYPTPPRCQIRWEINTFKFLCDFHLNKAGDTLYASLFLKLCEHFNVLESRNVHVYSRKVKMFWKG